MRFAELIAAQPWAITEGWLQRIVAAARREDNRVEALESRRGMPMDGAVINPWDGNSRASLRNGVAVLNITGPVFRYSTHLTQMLDAIFGVTLLDRLALDFDTALRDERVSSIVFNCDSPGGQANGIHEFGEIVYAARGRKPIVAYVGSAAASAAYWIASAADSIVIDRTAMLGSIGVVIAVENPGDSPQDMEVVSAKSPRKRLDPFTDEGRSELQTIVDVLADVFLGAVARNRGVDQAVVESDFGQGGLLIGEAAVAAQLADGLGSLEMVITNLSAGRSPIQQEDSMKKQQQNVAARAAKPAPVAKLEQQSDPIAEDTSSAPADEKDGEESETKPAVEDQKPGDPTDETTDPEDEKGDAESEPAAAAAAVSAAAVKGGQPKVTGDARIKQLEAELAMAKRSQISAEVAAVLDPLKASMKINSAEAEAFQRRLTAARQAGDAEAESDIMTMLSTRSTPLAPTDRFEKGAVNHAGMSESDIIVRALQEKGIKPGSARWTASYTRELKLLRSGKSDQ